MERLLIFLEWLIYYQKYSWEGSLPFGHAHKGSVLAKGKDLSESGKQNCEPIFYSMKEKH